MRFRSTACVLGGILLAGHRAGLADSQSSNLSISVVVTRSCSISTPASGGVTVNCSRGPTPAIQSSAPLAPTAAPTPIGQAFSTGRNSAVAPRQSLAAAPAASSQTVDAGPATSPLEPTADELGAETGDTPPVPDASAAAAETGNATTQEVRPLQQLLTINF